MLTRIRLEGKAEEDGLVLWLFKVQPLTHAASKAIAKRNFGRMGKTRDFLSHFMEQSRVCNQNYSAFSTTIELTKKL
ncbi:Hypothetical protein Minf_2463 [Methylacidiphilum infernorum V4]|uniref:Uncharacterized protein n=1 Tax=Methylacidiphilum infernorum (isolate V4) TaxID=481448 RepID=B3E140_METI4|nr:Hypothetical protein Minf_2463 [Methylacidiphilum infernorum V4]